MGIDNRCVNGNGNETVMVMEKVMAKVISVADHNLGIMVTDINLNKVYTKKFF